jgi:hypothetical protein
MVAGRRAWVERMKAEGKKFPGGRKPGSKWITPMMRAREQLAHLVHVAEAAESARKALASKSLPDRIAGALGVPGAAGTVRANRQSHRLRDGMNESAARRLAPVANATCAATPGSERDLKLALDRIVLIAGAELARVE